jgi:hypothetical protein
VLQISNEGVPERMEGLAVSYPHRSKVIFSLKRSDRLPVVQERTPFVGNTIY